MADGLTDKSVSRPEFIEGFNLVFENPYFITRSRLFDDLLLI